MLSERVILLVGVICLVNRAYSWQFTLKIGYMIEDGRYDDEYHQIQKYARAIEKIGAPNTLKLDIALLNVTSDVQAGTGLLTPLRDFIIKENTKIFIGRPNDQVEALIGTLVKPGETQPDSVYLQVDDGPPAQPDCRKNSNIRNSVQFRSVSPLLDEIFVVVNGFLATISDPCKRVVIITENTDDMRDVIKRWSRIMLNNEICAQEYAFVIPNEDTRDIRAHLFRARNLGISHFMVYSKDLAYTSKVINVARGLNLVTYLYRWMVMNMGIGALPEESISEIRAEGAVITTFNILRNEVFTKHGLEVPPIDRRYLAATQLDSLLLLANLATIQGNAGKTTLTLDDIIAITMGDQQDPKPAVFKSKVIQDDGVLGPISNFPLRCRKPTNIEVYTLQGNEGMKKVDSHNNLGVFLGSEDTPPAPPSFGYDPNKIQSIKRIFNSKTVKVVTREDPPFIFRIRQIDENGTVSYVFKGMMVDYMKVYAKLLDFEPEFYLVPDGDMGRYEPGVGWTGMVRELLIGNASLIAGAFNIDVNRSRVIDYTEPTFPGSLSLLMKAPFVKMERWQFLQPFSRDLWLLVLGVFVVMSILLHILTRIDYTTDTISISDSFYFAISVMTSGGSETNPTAIPSRIMVAVLMFFGIVLSASYTANMTAFLTLRNEQAQIRTLEGLATQYWGTYGVVKGSEVMNMLERSTTYPEVLLWSGINRERSDHIIKDYDTAVRRVQNRSDPFILITESMISNYYTSKICELIAVSQDSYSMRYAIGFPQGLLIKMAFDEVISSIREQGSETEIQERWYEEEMCPNRDSKSSTKIDTRPLTMFEMLGVFIALFIGVALSLFAAIVGALVRKWHDKQGNVKVETIDH